MGGTGANGNGLRFSRDSAEAGLGEDVVQIVENRVDAGKLIEQANGNGKEYWQPVFAGEEGFVGMTVLGVDGFDDLAQLLLVVFFAYQLKHLARFVDPSFLCQPAGAAGN